MMQARTRRRLGVDVEAGAMVAMAGAKKRHRKRDCCLKTVVVMAVTSALSGAGTWMWRCPRQEAGTGPVVKKALARVFTFHKNERYLLEDWLAYHCHVFGCENVVVVDHASDDAEVVRVLDAYARKGVAVVPFSGSFKDKASALSAAMRAGANGAEFLVPVDVDEFVVLEKRTGGGVGADRDEILAAFDALPRADRRKFKFNSRVADCPLTSGDKRPALQTRFSPARSTSMGKTFFHAGADFVSTDQGNHFGRVRRDNATNQDAMLAPRNFDKFFQRTTLTLLHFSMPDFDTWRTKLVQRARAYGFTMSTQCDAVRKGQRYCRSFQTLRAGRASLDETRAEYRSVCAAIANQQNMYNPNAPPDAQKGGAGPDQHQPQPALADLLRRLNPPSSTPR